MSIKQTNRGGHRGHGRSEAGARPIRRRVSGGVRGPARPASEADRGSPLPRVPGAAGTSHLYLNAGVPRDRAADRPLGDLALSICPVCGHGYADVLRRKVETPDATILCEECRLDAWAQHVAQLEAELGGRLDGSKLPKSTAKNSASVPRKP